MSLTDDLKDAIITEIPDAKVIVKSNDEVHFFAEITSKAFIGISRIKQHKLIYTAIANKFGQNWSEIVHAIEIKTITEE